MTRRSETFPPRWLAASLGSGPSPHPIYEARPAPYPNSVIPLGEDCDPSHARGSHAAGQVKLWARILVWCQQWDLRDFTYQWMGVANPNRYLDYFTGHSFLNDDGQIRFRNGLLRCGYCVIVKLAMAEAGGERASQLRVGKPSFDKLVAAVHEPTYVVPGQLYSDHGTLRTWPRPPRTSLIMREHKASYLWGMEVELLMERYGLEDRCPCHTLARAWRDGYPGPVVDRMSTRGGDRSAAGGLAAGRLEQ